MMKDDMDSMGPVRGKDVSLGSAAGAAGAGAASLESEGRKITLKLES